MATEQELREALCEIGRRVWDKGFVASNDGNFSFRLDENRVLCTPTMISKGFLKPDDLVIVDLEGNQLSGHRRSTSEVKIHLNIYKHRPEIYSVVHTHPPHATAFAITKTLIPKGILPEMEIFLGDVPTAPYETTGTWEFAESIDPWVETHDAFLLTNHGLVTVGQDPYDAYYKTETVDQYCRILLLARQLGSWETLSRNQLEGLLQLKAKLGVPEYRKEEELFAPVTGETTGRRGPAPAFKPHEGPLEDRPKLKGV